MAETERLERLIADERGTCCAGDIEQRLDELTALKSDATGDVAAATAAFGALANDTRYTLLSVLVAAEDELCVCELSPLVDVSEAAVSHGLSRLRGAGLVTRHKQGKWHYYAATDRGERLLGAL
jgi:DNA-binding transcriptional ArsR family regulator